MPPFLISGIVSKALSSIFFSLALFFYKLPATENESYELNEKFASDQSSIANEAFSVDGDDDCYATNKNEVTTVL